MTCDAKESKATSCRHIFEYVELVETGKINACKEQKRLVAYIRKCFAVEDIYVDEEQLEKYLSLAKYFPYDELFPWERFCLALHCCTYWRKTGLPRWTDLFLLIGRGAGKDGFIAFESACLISPYNGIQGYDVDICANSELQAKAPFVDFYNVLESPQNRSKLIRYFYWNKEDIVCLKTKSTLKYRTNNPKGKDGLRSGIVVFNELHQYENYDNINVFTTGLGKKKHPRRLYATTNGDVRGGPLDDYLERSLGILEGGQPDIGWLPFICRLDKKEEVDSPELWEKANPSLPYIQSLRDEIEKEYREWKVNPSQFTAFMTKRMNLPDGNREIQVTSWELIMAASRPVPEVKSKIAVAALDYASMADFASAGILTREGNVRVWKTHSWLNANSKDIHRLKIPWREWERLGYLTVVDDVEIGPELLAHWIELQALDVLIRKIAMDNFRYALVKNALLQINFDANERKNIKLVRPSDMMIVSPVIESCFSNQLITWGDNPLMRWATNNVKMIRTGINKDTGNMTYGKIEPKSRKTDPFMAFAAAMTIESELGPIGPAAPQRDLGVWTF